MEKWLKKIGRRLVPLRNGLIIMSLALMMGLCAFLWNNRGDVVVVMRVLIPIGGALIVGAVGLGLIARRLWLSKKNREAYVSTLLTSPPPPGRELRFWLEVLDPTEFEQEVAAIFQWYFEGRYVVQHRGQSNDKGVDVALYTPGGALAAIIQVKQWRNPVSMTILRDLYGTMHDLGVRRGYIVTTSRFTEGEMTYARERNIHLISGQMLVRMYRRVFERRLKRGLEVPQFEHVQQQLAAFKRR
jgi:hypothetical protein